MTRYHRAQLHRVLARRNTGGLSETEKDLLRAAIREEGVSPDMVEEALGAIDNIIRQAPDVDVDFILEALDDVVEIYGGAAAPAAAPAAPAPAPILQIPKTLNEQYPRPVVEEDDAFPMKMVREVFKLTEQLKLTEDGRKTFLAIRAPDTFSHVVADTVNPDDLAEVGEVRFGNVSRWQQALQRQPGFDPQRAYRPLFRFVVTMIRGLLKPGIVDGEASFGDASWGGEGRYKRYRRLPVALAVLSDALGIPYNVEVVEQHWPDGDLIPATRLVTLGEGEGWVFRGRFPESAYVPQRIVLSFKKTGSGAQIPLSMEEIADRGERLGYAAGKIGGGSAVAFDYAMIPKLAKTFPELNIDPKMADTAFCLGTLLSQASARKEPDESLIALLTEYTPEDAEFLKRYYDHFDKLTMRKANRPNSRQAELATVKVMRVVMEGMTDFQYFPAIVAEVPKYLGQSTERVTSDRTDGIGYGFRIEKMQTTVRIWIPAPWTTGNLSESDRSSWSAISGTTRGSNAKGGPTLFSRSVPNVSGKYVSAMSPTPVQWRIPANLLSKQGIEWAQKATGFDPKYQNASGWNGAASDVVLAYPHFEMKLSELSEGQIVATALYLEATGLHPLAAALRIAYGGQAMPPEVDERLTFLAKSPRIDDKVVTGKKGTTLEVIGLAKRDVLFSPLEIAGPELRAKAHALQPPDSFKAVVKTPPKKVGGKPGTATYRPFDYQRVGIAFSLLAGGKALICDEMGLGKTIQALGFLSVNPNPVNDQPSLPALIVCPGSVVTNWVRECNQWLPKLKAVMYESGKDTANVKHDVMVASWDMIALYPDQFQSRGYATMICDEAHYAKRLMKRSRSKNKSRKTIAQLMGRSGATARISWAPYTGRTAAMLLLSESIPNKIMLTGTPMPNGDPVSFWTLLHSIAPERFPEQRAFEDEFDLGDPSQRKSKKPPKLKKNADPAPDIVVGQGPESEAGEKDPFAKITKLTKLAKTLDGYMVRRVKQNVADQTNLGDLVIAGQGRAAFGAEKRLSTLRIQLTEEQDAYLEAFDKGLKDLIKEIHWSYRVETAVKAVLMGEDIHEVIERVNKDPVDPEKIEQVALAVASYERQYVGELKVPNAADWIRNKVEVRREPAVVWVDHQNVADALDDVLSNMTIDGKPVRYAMINGKNNNTPKKKGEIVAKFQSGAIDVIVGSQSMAEGVTLTRANEALFVEYWWMPGKLTQAQDRIYRVGQKEDVLISTLHAPGTIDDKMRQKLGQKDASIEEVTGADVYAQSIDYTGLPDDLNWMVDVILDRLQAQIKKASLISGRVTLEDLEDALSDNPKNIIEVYTLGQKYADPSVLSFPTKLLVTPEEAEELIEKTKGIAYTTVLDTIITALADAKGQTLPRLTLIADVGRTHTVKAARVDTEIGKLAKLGIVTPYQEVGQATRERGKTLKAIEAFQKAGGVLEKPEIKDHIVLTTAELRDLIAQGVLTVERKPKVRMNPRRNPGQMVVNGKLPVLPYNYVDAAAGHDCWVPGSPEAIRAEKQRLADLRKVRNAIARGLKSKRGSLPSLTYPADRLALLLNPRSLRDPELLDLAFRHYGDLRDAVLTWRKAKHKVPDHYVRLLQRAHKALAPYAS